MSVGRVGKRGCLLAARGEGEQAGREELSTLTTEERPKDTQNIFCARRFWATSNVDQIPSVGKIAVHFNVLSEIGDFAHCEILETFDRLHFFQGIPHGNGDVAKWLRERA